MYAFAHEKVKLFLAEKSDRQVYAKNDYSKNMRKYVYVVVKIGIWTNLEFVQTKLEFQFCPDKTGIFFQKLQRLEK